MITTEYNLFHNFKYSSNTIDSQEYPLYCSMITTEYNLFHNFKYSSNTIDSQEYPLYCRLSKYDRTMHVFVIFNQIKL